MRDYGVDGQLGLESTPDEYVANMVAVFREVRRVLADDGTLWLNLGDSYASGEVGRHDHAQAAGLCTGNALAGRAAIGDGMGGRKQRKLNSGVKPKDLVGIPWLVAFALRADGWFLRSDIIWAKPNPMPESVTDRPTKAHEYLFLLSKQPRYFYDAEAIADHAINAGRTYRPGPKSLSRGQADGAGVARSGNANRDEIIYADKRNRRTVWTIPTEPYSGAHFATFPKALVTPCILAGSALGDAVLDPFMGSGTVGQVAESLGRRWFGCELSDAYGKLAGARTAQTGLRFK